MNDRYATISIPLNIEALATWLTSDIVSHDDKEPTTPDEAISHIKTLIEDFAADHRHDMVHLFSRMVALLIEAAAK